MITSRQTELVIKKYYNQFFKLVKVEYILPNESEYLPLSKPTQTEYNIILTSLQSKGQGDTSRKAKTSSGKAYTDTSSQTAPPSSSKTGTPSVLS
jgi:hypothetical protein